MRDGVVLFVLVVAAIGGIAAWTMYVDHAPRGFVGQAAGLPQTPAEASPPPARKLPPKSSKPAVAGEQAAVAEPAAAGSAPASPEVRDAPSPAPVAAAPAPPPPRPFPSVGEINVGAGGDAITDAYGDPALSATTSDRGHVIETFVYARDGIRDVTVISLEDGRVSSAYSKPKATSSVAAPPPLRRRGG